MVEQIIAWAILAAVAPLVLMACFNVDTGRGFWRDYRDMFIALIGIVIGIAAVFAVAWAVSVVAK